MVDHERRVGRLPAGEGGERHLGAAVGDDVGVAQLRRVLPVGRGHLHHHMILVEGIVDGRNLPLAEQVVQRGVELEQVHPEPRRRIAVDHERRLQSEVLLVGAHVNDVSNPAQRLADARLPGAQLVDVVRTERVLVLGVRRPAADPYVLRGLEEKGGAGLVRKLSAEPRDDHVRGNLPPASGFRMTKKKALLRWPPPVNATTWSTAGSAFTIATKSVSF